LSNLVGNTISSERAGKGNLDEMMGMWKYAQPVPVPFMAIMHRMLKCCLIPFYAGRKIVVA
jgi:hypothetical protein